MLKKVMKWVLIVVLILASCAGMETCDRWMEKWNNQSTQPN
jgi:hypothetical protein